jgi:hypothetical protein
MLDDRGSNEAGDGLQVNALVRMLVGVAVVLAVLMVAAYVRAAEISVRTRWAFTPLASGVARAELVVDGNVVEAQVMAKKVSCVGTPVRECVDVTLSFAEGSSHVAAVRVFDAAGFGGSSNAVTFRVPTLPVGPELALSVLAP